MARVEGANSMKGTCNGSSYQDRVVPGYPEYNITEDKTVVLTVSTEVPDTLQGKP
jgi:hypothetical protein